MSEIVMLVLIGGRSAVPTIVGILQFLGEVHRIKFLLCEGEQYLKFQKNIETVIKQEKENIFFNYDTDVISVDPSKFDEVYLAVHHLCKDVKNLKYVNLTSAPQTMSIPVYGYVQENYKDVLIFSVNTDQSQIIPLIFKKPSLPFNKQLTVDNYITLLGINIFKKKKDCGSNIEELAKYISQRIQLQINLISEIRHSSGLGNEIKNTKGIKIDQEKFTRLGNSINDLEDLLQKLEDNLIIHKLEKIDKIFKFQIKTNEAYSFLNGDWLEILVYSLAKKCDFDSIEMGVELDNYRGEIDVFCLNNANAMICECKTGNFESEDIIRLSSKGEKLGGNYCVKLFITTNFEVSDKCKNTAHNNRVVIISGQDLVNLTEILVKEMQAPTYPRR